MKKILIISNNPLSYSQHNAKTVLSLLDHEDYCLFQIFFKDDVPDFESCSYFRISDRDMIRSLALWKPAAGETVSAVKREQAACAGSSVSQSAYWKRLMREYVWLLGRRNKKALYCELDRFSPDILFFVGGDCVFSYRIYSEIASRYPQAKRVIFLTDDYILSKAKKSLPQGIRRRMLIKQMSNCLPETNLLITISEKMRTVYRGLFGADSVVYSNMPDSPAEHPEVQTGGTVEFVYAGGLHYHRWKTLSLLGQAILAYNRTDPPSVARLRIYSPHQPEQSILDSLCIEDSSEFCGSLAPEEVDSVLSSCDVEVHVESFDEECKEATRLSFSTKIFEYLQKGKCVLAIGPADIASMEYLSGGAYCINDPEKINAEAVGILCRGDMRNQIAAQCADLYDQRYFGSDNRDGIRKKINEL